ncbi:MAG: ATP-binding protein [Bacteroidales bacterium]|nr:ATP-binding protein [Bacteroidales bacterium]
MKYLNKIIFINSAHIRYAEIQLDGNVHFTGTQGVGKSTLLRALLFFYNADKQHLGIKQGQSSFDQFYFENSNSFIVYEIKRDIGAYTIITIRHQGSAAFRFIDAPYNKDWFVSETGEVLSEWTKIRQNITQNGNIDISQRIDNYQNYRDIIFGNAHDRANKFAKYALVESTNYQNIPRSIQNVFLNSKLDAEFVKKTIIESMTDSETEEAIKLSVYRSLVADFEREYDDIHIWYKTEKNGDILVRRQANQVISTYRETVALEQQIRRAVRELNYAVQQTQEQLPVVQEELKHTDEQILAERQKKGDIEKERDKELSRLRESIGKQKYLLEQIREKRKHYAEMDIDVMIRLHQSEPKLQIERKHKQDVLDALTKQFADIEAKYKLLFGSLENNFIEFKNQQSEQLNKLRDELQKQRDKFDKEKQKQLDESEKRYTESQIEIDSRFETINDDKNKAESKLKELQHWQPYAQEKAALLDELKQFEIEEKETSANKQTKEQEIKSFRANALTEEEKANSDYKIQEEQLKNNQRQLQKELDNINTLLARYKGSLYEWLAQNKPQWGNTIGRVIDEERVLYAQGLSPVNIEDGNTLYGVQIDLSHIEPTHHTPDEYRKRSKELEDQISNIKKLREELLQNKEQIIQKISERLSDKIKPLQQEITNYSVRLGQIPQQRKDRLTQIATFERKEKEERDIKIDAQQKVLNEIILKISQVKKEKGVKRSLWEKEKKQINSNYESKLKELKKQLEELQANQDAELKEEQGKYNLQKSKYENERKAELHGKGADTTSIKKQEDEIKSIDNQLQTIEKQRKTIYDYQKDKEELFDKEDSIKQEKKTLEDKIGNLQNQYNEKIRRITTKLNDLQEQWNKQNSKIKEWQEGLSQYKQIIDIEHLLTDSYLQDEKTIQSSKSCQMVIGELRGAINGKRDKQDELKRNVRLFNTHFAQNNTFSFNTMPNADEDFINIALSLQDFVVNNKIEEYQKRTNEHYQNILQGVSREIGNLMNHQSEIEKVIRDINRDFVERNFAGVIKGIELRAEQSDDSMMRLLQKIKTFTDENNLMMGEVNIFNVDKNKERDEINRKVVDYLIQFMKQLQKEPNKQQLTLSDTFNLQFRVKENDQDTGWVERINNVGSDGTDILVKAMINIMLINVFKNKAMRNKNQEFIIHCMMDEIGKLHSNNVRGILRFANQRNIYLVNSSPESLNAYDYKYTYMLSKDAKSMTQVTRLLKNSINE